MKTENLTGRSTHAHVSGCAPCSTVVSDVHVSSNAPALAQGSVRVVCVKTLRLLRGHSSIACLVATSWACLTVSLLFLTDWRQNQVSPASIPAAMAGLPKRLKSPRSLPLHASLSVGGNFVGGAVPMPFGISSSNFFHCFPWRRQHLSGSLLHLFFPSRLPIITPWFLRKVCP